VQILACTLQKKYAEEKIMIKVFEVKLDLYFKKDISFKEISYRISRFLNYSFTGNEEMTSMHNEKCYKKYCFDSPYPIEPSKVYKQDNTYSIRIRTIDLAIAEYFWLELSGFKNDDFIVVGSTNNITPQKPIEKIYSLTPAIIKTETGYWANNNDFAFFKNALNTNMVKKYNYFTGEHADTSVFFFEDVVLQKKPFTIMYKNNLFFGNKAEILIKNDQVSQNIAYLALGVGICENNTAGSGFMNCKWKNRRYERMVTKC